MTAAGAGADAAGQVRTPLRAVIDAKLGDGDSVRWFTAEAAAGRFSVSLVVTGPDGRCGCAEITAASGEPELRCWADPACGGDAAGGAAELVGEFPGVLLAIALVDGDGLAGDYAKSASAGRPGPGCGAMRGLPGLPELPGHGDRYFCGPVLRPGDGIGYLHGRARLGRRLPGRGSGYVR